MTTPCELCLVSTSRSLDQRRCHWVLVSDCIAITCKLSGQSTLILIVYIRDSSLKLLQYLFKAD